ncbi:MAG: hypothetical protein GC162_19950 [Planctomycetes bacterium]|nr:hypothetical protein [Planctomycetota bacterium]
MRTASQNATFISPPFDDDPYEPPGQKLASHLANSLGTLESICQPVSPVENWRDAGWSIEFKWNDADLLLVVAGTGEINRWGVQIADANPPGLFSRLFGKRASDHSMEVWTVARFVNAHLDAMGCSMIRWRIDGYPDETFGEPTPPEPKRSSGS